MGRYSFFIVSSFINGYSVSATGELDNDLFWRDKQYIPIVDNVSGDNKNLLDSDSLGIQQTENQDSYDTEVEQEVTEQAQSRQGITTYAQTDSITLLEKRVESIRKEVSNNSTNIKSIFSAIHSINEARKAHDAWASNLANIVYGNTSRISFLETWKIGHDSWAASQKQRIDNSFTRINNLESWTKSHDSWAATLASRVNANANNIDILSNKINVLSSSVDKFKSNVQSQIDSHNNKINELYSFNTGKTNMINELYKLVGERKAVSDKHNTYIGQLFDNVNRINSNLTANDNKINELYSFNTSKTNMINELYKLVGERKAVSDKHNTYIGQLFDNITRINSDLTVNDNKISNLQRQIDNLNTGWSDVGIIASLVSVKDSIDNFKTDFNDLFGSNGELGLNAHDGIFTSMLKHQFIALRNDIRDLFSSKGSFWTDLKALLDIYFDINNKDSGLYRIRYSIVAGFGDLEKILDLIGTDTLNLRKSLITTNDSLMILKDWLKLIYEKPVGSVTVTVPPVTVPPFDFNRLEQILKSLSFGDVVNEAGTNFWDFMKELIKSLGDILTTAISGVKDVLMRIFDLLDKLVDTIIKLIVPDNLDFLDSQWTKTLDKIKVKFSFIFDSVDSIKSIFSGEKKNFEDMDIKLNAGKLGNNSFSLGSVKLPVSHLNTFLIYVKPIANAFVLLWFLIDMYKWIHERNAVVE